ncbi:peptide deformylase [Streptomyces sp. N2-109]|uniref:Peptide deformylase n=1 Tax=Streptomyces gossypii TaxID=2883101 RepID=A0ABT2K1G6_9ACTN|nr:peptide deformylase [Streptomyces gossypii]MCT2593941.1 peptide deformylase [Streptomyces gossypii]
MARATIPGSSGSPIPLRLFGDPALQAPCREAGPADGPLDQLVEDMYATMYAARGVGLAANQIGVPLRVFVFDCPDDEDRRYRGHVINPRLLSTAGVMVRGPEGCLSLPGLEAATERHDEAEIEGVDLRGRPLRIRGSGYFARCLQHEYDHLEGGLYCDRLSGVRRARLMRAARRASWA